MIIPVVLSGGSGTRLWPLSRALRPKQLLPLVTENTMIQDTVLRVANMDNVGAPVIICNDEHRFAIAEQMQQINISPKALILEPFGRNTAPAVAVAAFKAMQAGDDPVLLVLPADHVITDLESFNKAVQAGCQAADDDKLVTFGIIPAHPETGYGYIKAGNELDASGVYTVARFVEKPTREVAEEYISEGGYYWNSGMFMFKASVYLRELEKNNVEIFNHSRTAIENAVEDLDFTRLENASFESCPGDSIDYAVMEKTEEAVIVPVEMGWSDIGSWSALLEVEKSDSAGNVIHGDVQLENTSNSYIRAESRLVSTVGVRDHVIVETADAVLVAHKDNAQDVKTIVDKLKQENRDEVIVHRKAYRPWGSYERIDCAERFQVKRITVKPNARLSLQMHHHRAEHWIVVSGTARVTCGDNVFLLTENESTFIPLGEKHRLENAGKIPLELIEVQTGSYLGEDDIVRFDDVYGRTKS